MASTSDKLPFVPPVDGCRIDRIHRVGPLVTRVDFRMPGGSPRVWTSRRYRWMGGIRALSGPAPAARDAPLR